MTVLSTLHRAFAVGHVVVDFDFAPDDVRANAFDFCQHRAANQLLVMFV